MQAFWRLVLEKTLLQHGAGVRMFVNRIKFNVEPATLVMVTRLARCSDKCAYSNEHTWLDTSTKRNWKGIVNTTTFNFHRISSSQDFCHIASDGEKT